MNKTKFSRSFEDLKQATEPDEIVRHVSLCIHYQNGEGEPPIPTLEDLSNPDWWNCPGNHNAREIFSELHEQMQKHSKEAIDIHMELTEQDRKDLVNLNPDFTQEQVKAIAEKQIPAADTLRQKSHDFFILITYFAQAFNLRDISERIETIHIIWLIARETNKQLRHPLAPIVTAWLKSQIPTVDPERRKGRGIMPHKIRDSFPAVESQGEGFDVGNFPQGGREIQGVLPGFEFPKSEIVPALPLVAYDTAGGKTKSGRGAPIDQRLFVNLLIEYPKHERFGVTRIGTTYRDIRGWLYPNGTRESKKTLIPKLQEGFKNLHNLWFEWERRAWNIIAVDALPTMDTKPDDPLSFTIRFPEGMNTGGGASIGLDALRTYGAQSAPKFRAWVRLAYLWDAAKVKNGGKRIYATIPEVLRDSDRHITDATGQKILTGELYHTKKGWKFRQGNLPQNAWYHPLAIRTGRQIRNPQADKVPILDDADMVKLFYDHDKRKGEAFRKTLHDARKHAEEMEDDGYIVIGHDAVDAKTDKRGWRILEARAGNITKLSSW